MSTDQLQTRLYARSDAQTKRAVDAALEPLYKLLSAKSATGHPVHLKVTARDMRLYDGTTVHSGMSNDTIANAVLSTNDSTRSYLVISALPLVQALAKTLAVSLQSEDRKVFVEQFIREVESLREKVDELDDRLGAVE